MLVAPNTVDDANWIALLHWKWAREAGVHTLEEKIVLIGLTAHLALNAVRYVQAGDAKVGAILLTAAATATSAFALQK